MVTLVNCSDERVEVWFDGQPYEFDPMDEVMVSDEVGRHLLGKSIIHHDPITGEAVYQLCYKDQMPAEIVTRRSPELLIRDNMDPKDRNVKYVNLVNPVAPRDPFQEAREETARPSSRRS